MPRRWLRERPLTGLATGRRNDRPHLVAHRILGRLGVPSKLTAYELCVTGAVLVQSANNVKGFTVSRASHHDVQLTGATFWNLTRCLELTARQTQVDKLDRDVSVKQSSHDEYLPPVR